MAEEIVFVSGKKPAMEQVRQYFQYLFQAERSGDPFPVDLDHVYDFAYSSKAVAKRALVTSDEFFEGEDYHISRNAENPKRPQGGAPSEKILLSIPCFEYFIVRKLRPAFEVYRECRKLVTEAAIARSTLPYHLRRYIANQDQVPFGHFSTLQQTTIELIAPLEAQGYTLRDNMLPDCSLGKAFCKWLREHGHDPDSYPSYDHHYEDGRVVRAKAYPIDRLPDFYRLFHEEWLVKRAPKYFEERDKGALPHITKMLEEPK
jgi:hypothetical protein